MDARVKPGHDVADADRRVIRHKRQSRISLRSIQATLAIAAARLSTESAAAAGRQHTRQSKKQRRQKTD
jgi:hypothetical protein